MNKQNQLIKLDNASKYYGKKQVLHNVTLEISAGECLTLVGHNGAGKTTIMKLVLGLTQASNGNVTVFNHKPGTTPFTRYRKQFGYLPENVAFDEAMSGKEALVFYARLKGVTNKACDELLKNVGLTDAATQRIRTYSKGMRQRLGLAQAIIGHPRLLVLDEPTSGLDPSLRQHFFTMIKKLRDDGVAILLSSHALSETEMNSDRIAIMKAGRLLVCGNIDELRQQADIPVQIRISIAKGKIASVAERLPSQVTLHKVNEHAIDMFCPSKNKMKLIHDITQLGDPVEDINIIPPRLEEIYSHYSDEEFSL